MDGQENSVQNSAYKHALVNMLLHSRHSVLIGVYTECFTYNMTVWCNAKLLEKYIINVRKYVHNTIYNMCNLIEILMVSMYNVVCANYGLSESYYET